MLEQVFVPFIPDVGPSQRDLSLNPAWRPFINAFNTWMDQAQSIKKVDSNLHCSRIGNQVVFTGTVAKGAKFECLKPIESFSHGSVLFSKEGYLENGGDEVSISVTYITKE